MEDLKKSTPVEVAEHAITSNIENEVAFNWWFLYVLKKRESRMSQVTSRIRKISHKHGFEAPNSLNHADEIDSRNNSTFWKDSIAKEMSIIGVAFDALEKD